MAKMDHFSSVAQSCPTLCNPMNCSTPGLPVHHQLLEFTQLMSTESVMPSNHLIICCPLLLPPSIFPSIRVFSNESALRIKWPKYWSFSFNISLSNEYSGRISFRMDWLDLLAVQGTLKSLLQHQVQKHQFFGASIHPVLPNEDAPKGQSRLRKAKEQTAPLSPPSPPTLNLSQHHSLFK